MLNSFGNSIIKWGDSRSVKDDKKTILLLVRLHDDNKLIHGLVVSILDNHKIPNITLGNLLGISWVSGFNLLVTM